MWWCWTSRLRMVCWENVGWWFVSFFPLGALFSLLFCLMTCWWCDERESTSSTIQHSLWFSGIYIPPASLQDICLFNSKYIYIRKLSRHAAASSYIATSGRRWTIPSGLSHNNIRRLMHVYIHSANWYWAAEHDEMYITWRNYRILIFAIEKIHLDSSINISYMKQILLHGKTVLGIYELG
jgi:hypothetical protein